MVCNGTYMWELALFLSQNGNENVRNRVRIVARMIPPTSILPDLWMDDKYSPIIVMANLRRMNTIIPNEAILLFLWILFKNGDGVVLGMGPLSLTDNDCSESRSQMSEMCSQICVLSLYRLSFGWSSNVSSFHFHQISQRSKVFSTCFYRCLCFCPHICLAVGQVMSPYHSDPISQKSYVIL